MQSSLASTFRISRGRTRQAGFTLLEVLLAIAILVLLGSVLIGGGAHLLSDRPVTVQEVFWKAVQEARKAALKAEHDIRLKYDKEKRRFLIVDGLAPARLAADGFTKEEAALKEFPIPTASTAQAGSSDLDISFLAATKSGPAILIGGVLLESQPVPYVTFYSDGTCSAFRLQIMRSGNVSMLAIDPWTCAPVLSPTDANAL